MAKLGIADGPPARSETAERPLTARSVPQSVTIAIQNPDHAIRQSHGATMKSARFIHLVHRRNFRFGMAAAFLLGLGILAACRMPQSYSAHAEDAVAAVAQ